MKIRQILLSMLCALFALSCVEDVTEDIYIGPDGQTYFTLSFNATGVALGTKVGFDPTGESGSYLYWTDSEDISVVHVNNDSKLYSSTAVEYTAPEDGETLASFSITDFEVPASATEVQIFAMTGDVEFESADVCTVSVPQLNLQYSGGSYQYDSYSSGLPFISPTESAEVTTTTTGHTSYDNDAPTLMMVPFFRTMKILMSNIDATRTETMMKYVEATITLDDGIYFYDKLTVTPSLLSYDNDVNTAVTTAVSGTTESNKSSITTTVTYAADKSFAILKDLQIPLASLSTSSTMYGNKFTVEVSFYDTNEKEILYGTCKQTYTATADFGYGELDDITPEATSFTYDLDKSPSVTDVTATAQGIATPEILVEWKYPDNIANTEGVEIAGVKIYYGTTADCEETPIVIQYNGDNPTTSYTLGELETLDWATEYYIYVATYTKDYAETPTTPVTETTVALTDLRYNTESEIYEIYTAKGLAAFSNLVNLNVQNDVDGLVATTSDGSEFTTFGKSNSNINGQVMTTIDMATYSGFSGITYYSGTFDGGNGLSEGSATNITIKNLTPNGDGLFNVLSDGATIKNVTLTDIVATSSNTANIGAIATTILADATINISYCEVSGSVSGEGVGTGGLVGCAWSNSTLIIDNSTNSATVTINNIDYNSTRGLVGFVNDGVTITFTNCVDTVAGENVSTDMQSTEVVVSQNSTYDGFNVRWTPVVGEGSDDVIIATYVNDYTNPTVGGESDPVKLSEGVISFTGLAEGTYDVTISTANYLNESEYATVNGVPLEEEVYAKITIGEPANDIVLNGDTYEIYTAEGLMTFAEIVNDGTDSYIPTKSTDKNASANAKVMANIDMSGKVWTPIGNYSGTFDGGSESFFEIQNLKGTNGLFSSTSYNSGASISNVILVDPIIECTTTFVSIGAIAGTLEYNTSITNCVVKGGSVETTVANSITGALVGTNLGSISSSSSSCSVTIEDNLYNGGTDSCLVGSNNGSVSADCYDNYEEGEAAKDAEEATIASAVPMYTSDGSVSTVVVTLSFENGEDSVDAKKVYYTGASNGSAKVGDENTVTLTLTADQTYTIYAVTTNYLEAETKGEEITVTTYGANTYNSEALPAIVTAKANDYTDAITLTWSTEALSDYLQEIKFTYNTDQTETIDRAVIESGSITLTEVAYVTDIDVISYAGLYAPLAASSEKISKSGTDATITVESYDITIANGTYEIYSDKGLLAFAQIVNGVNTAIDGLTLGNGAALSTTAVADADAVLIYSIDLSKVTWLPIENYEGTFDGGNGGATPTTIEITGLTGSQGLFASTASGAIIKNVTLTASVTATAAATGILVSTATASTISYCNVSGSIDGGQQNTGGIVGQSACVSETSEVTTIEYCTNYATVSGTNNISGILGSRATTTAISYCDNYGTVTASGGSAGGVMGYGANKYNNSTTSNCNNYGYIKGTTSVGGMYGTVRGSTISNCTNSGTISGGTAGVGGIVGLNDNTAATITSSSNSGIIHATGNNAGGILGTLAKATTISGTGTNRGRVNSANADATGVGGIVGCLTYATDGTTGKITGDYTNYANVTVGGTLTLNSDGIDDDEIKGGTSINADGYGALGSGSESSGVTGTCKDEYEEPSVDTSADPVTVTSCAVDGTTPTTVNITWSYGDGYADISYVKVYYKKADDETYSLYGSIATSGTNSVTTTSLTGLTDNTIYNIFVVTVDNTESEVAAVGGGSQASPLYAMIGTAAGLDLIYYSTATTTYVANTIAINSDKGLYAFADIVNGNANTSSATAVNSNGSPYTFTESANTTVNGVVTTDIVLSTTANSWDDYAMTAYAGTFDGGNGLTDENATETGIEITNLTGSKGLFATIDDGAKIKNITITVNITSAAANTGGIVGIPVDSTTASISYCTINGNVHGVTGDSGSSGIGGVIGHSGSYSDLTISNITNNATIQGKSNLGGIIGAGNNTTAARPILTLTDCTNSGVISTVTSTIGGIYGYGTIASGSTFTRCKNTASFSGTNTVGGIVGNISVNATAGVIFEDCENIGDLTGSAQSVGGLIGGYHSNGNYTIKNSTNSGTIKGTYNVGGLVGTIQKGVIDGSGGDDGYSYNQSTGVVTATTDVTTVGGIVGNVASSLTLTNYINNAAVYTNTSTLVNGAGGAASIVGGSITGTQTGCSDSYYTAAN